MSDNLDNEQDLFYLNQHFGSQSSPSVSRKPRKKLTIPMIKITQEPSIENELDKHMKGHNEFTKRSNGGDASPSNSKFNSTKKNRKPKVKKIKKSPKKGITKGSSNQHLGVDDVQDLNIV
eukprot:CAMPEP_0114580016 /NCGR_PEP_ID=MMETSP0125-20121206/4349_1 /TAXON_ID=485358 ORGANISM="Aristerostoma sp., Strain ATCC 50986" /NCGR_SAMPLE_ID=MMETSP0125 /ASSEMBLY_ACC=CAM_ASM_000245 /LENGTH=119 /DNA_ID=CAMNT_0001771251 /DNA_START=1761 /DNA_END=2120 /DNA_ORIENTATION=+